VTVYRLIVQGELDQRYAYLFDGMDLNRVVGTTIVTGDVIDQAHLHGLIERIEELGLELLEIQQVAKGSGRGAGPERQPPDSA
jgi:hypothetical protein